MCITFRVHDFPRECPRLLLLTNFTYFVARTCVTTTGNATALKIIAPYLSRQCQRQMRCEAHGLPAAIAVAEVGTTAACNFTANCDYGKGSRDSAKATTKEQCCSLCQTRSGCAAGVFDGASCWFKTSQEIAHGCSHDPRSKFACVPAGVKPGPPPPPPPPPPPGPHPGEHDFSDFSITLEMLLVSQPLLNSVDVRIRSLYPRQHLSRMGGLPRQHRRRLRLGGDSVRFPTLKMMNLDYK